MGGQQRPNMQQLLSLVLLVSVCSAAILSDSDLSRANQLKPRDHLSGADFVSMTTNLNSHLHHVTDQQTKACAEFSDDELKTLVRILMTSKHENLQQIYQSNSDLRALPHDNLQALEEHWQKQQLVLKDHPDLAAMAKAAKCHQAVMIFAHHLTETARSEVVKLTQLPQLPTHQFTAPIAQDESRRQAIEAVHGDYVASTGCAAGHIIADGQSKFPKPGCLGTDECPVWPAEFSAPFGLYSHFPPIKNATSMFYYKITDGEKKQLVDYQTYCFPFTNLLHYKQPCKLYFQEEGIFLSQPGHVNCCTFKANVSAVPIQFLHSFTLKESNVKAQDYYGNEVSTDHWVGPLNFQYWTVGHNDTRYKNWGHDIVFQDGPTGVTWQWGNFDVSPQDDSIFKLPGTPEECAKSCPMF